MTRIRWLNGLCGTLNFHLILPSPLHYNRRCSEVDKFLLTYVILKLRLIKGKCILFVNDVDRSYRLKLFLEQFSIKSCVLNSELPLNSRRVSSTFILYVLLTPPSDTTPYKNLIKVFMTISSLQMRVAEKLKKTATMNKRMKKARTRVSSTSRSPINVMTRL